MSKKEIPREPEKTKLTRAQRKEIDAVIRKYKGDGKPHTAQATIPYEAMYPDGVCRLTKNTFSKCIAFEDISYIEFYILFLAILCVAIAAPTFAGEYQTGGDSILRTTKHGRTRLAITKILAAFTLFIVTFLVGITVHILILNVAFGTDCLKTSFQMLYSTTSPGSGWAGSSCWGVGAAACSGAGAWGPSAVTGAEASGSFSSPGPVFNFSSAIHYPPFRESCTILRVKFL